ncbi:Zinc transporter 2 [Eumeta japonica]|uniref:Zinc transporter 2 n=1 Tax=Eumeta variegata TaxID=151549 RepID=A0A4C1YBK8_EUMVA|nr:Zinc transporter 2 [Eumeta japonica]
MEVYNGEEIISSDVADHCHWKSQVEPPSAVPQLLTALLLCALFMICEVIGGYIAGSLSVMCDAAHMLSDCAGFGLALLAIRLARRGRDNHLSYGYRRAEVLGAMMSVLLIWILTSGFVYLAVNRLHTGDFEIDPDTMMIVSGIGVAFNMLMAFVLYSGCGSSIAHLHSHGGACSMDHHAHSHGHTHAHEENNTRLKFFNETQMPRANGGVSNGDYILKDMGEGEMNRNKPQARGRNINLRAAAVHVLGDLIQSTGVLIASIIIKIYPQAKIVDPLCTCAFSVLVFLTTVRVVRDAIIILMQGVPTNFKYLELKEALASVGSVRHVHSLHVWALSTHDTLMTAHVAIDEHADSEQVLQACLAIVKNNYNVQSATIQVERYNDMMRICPECRPQPLART